MKGSNYWDKIFNKLSESHLEKNVALYKGREHLDLIDKWYDNLDDSAVLKTDLFEECFGPDDILDRIEAPKKIGIDISKKITEQAAGKHNDIEPICCDVTNLPFKDRTFDLVISTSTLDHISRWHVPLALKEIRRVLVDDGNLMLTIDNRNNLLYHLGMFLGQKFKILPFYQERCYSCEEMGRLLQNTGFEVKEMDTIFHILPPVDKMLALLEKIYPSFEHRLSSSILDIFEEFKDSRFKFLTGRFLAFKVKKSD